MTRFSRHCYSILFLAGWISSVENVPLDLGNNEPLLINIDDGSSFRISHIVEQNGFAYVYGLPDRSYKPPVLLKTYITRAKLKASELLGAVPIDDNEAIQVENNEPVDREDIVVPKEDGIDGRCGSSDSCEGTNETPSVYEGKDFQQADDRTLVEVATDEIQTKMKEDVSNENVNRVSTIAEKEEEEIQLSGVKKKKKKKVKSKPEPSISPPTACSTNQTPQESTLTQCLEADSATFIGSSLSDPSCSECSSTPRAVVQTESRLSDEELSNLLSRSFAKLQGLRDLSFKHVFHVSPDDRLNKLLEVQTIHDRIHMNPDNLQTPSTDEERQYLTFLCTYAAFRAMLVNNNEFFLDMHLTKDNLLERFDRIKGLALIPTATKRLHDQRCKALLPLAQQFKGMFLSVSEWFNKTPSQLQQLKKQLKPCEEKYGEVPPDFDEVMECSLARKRMMVESKLLLAQISQVCNQPELNLGAQSLNIG